MNFLKTHFRKQYLQKPGGRKRETYVRGGEEDRGVEELSRAKTRRDSKVGGRRKRRG